MLQKIKIQGRELPCRVTMGAMRRFKRETGHDVSAMTASDIDDMIVFFWACTASACAADGVEFGMTPDEFADSIDPEGMNDFYSAMDEGEAKKKA